MRCIFELLKVILKLLRAEDDDVMGLNGNRIDKRTTLYTRKTILNNFY